MGEKIAIGFAVAVALCFFIGAAASIIVDIINDKGGKNGES